MMLRPNLALWRIVPVFISGRTKGSSGKTSLTWPSARSLKTGQKKSGKASVLSSLLSSAEGVWRTFFVNG